MKVEVKTVHRSGWGEPRTGAPRWVAAAAPAALPPARVDELPAAGPGASGAALLVTKNDPRIDRIAASRISVLIMGETGAGKEVLAQRLHERSGRSGKPLITVNCAAFCGNLIESELFGHQRGAFTGADQARVGLIEAADGGTLFLDELGELSAAAQTKLLRVLEAREVVRVGAVTPRPVDVRFIAATNVDLDAATATGRFRSDLLFRLEGIRLQVPPLRTRVDEIVPAALQFLDTFAAREGMPTPELTDAARSALRQHPWLGNFRELRNVVERAGLICDAGQIQPADLLLSDAAAPTADPASPAAAPSLAVASPRPAPVVAQPSANDQRVPSERDRIVAALKDCAGNQTRAARLLGISRRTLITRLQTFGLARPRARPLRIVPSAAAAPA